MSARSEIVVFHHALGRTEGVLAFAEALRGDGHIVHTPDLLDGRTFDSLDDGVGYARRIGFDAVIDRGVRAVDGLPERLVYVGFSLGVLPAQRLAQTRPGAVGALLVSACLPAAEFGGAWPDGTALQVHGMAQDPLFVDEGDLAAARDLVADVDGARLVLYPGTGHLLTAEVDGAAQRDAIDPFVEDARAFVTSVAR